MRAGFPGLRNVVAFNWTFYAAALFVTGSCAAGAWLLDGPARVVFALGAALALGPALSSTAVTLWVYDLSALYDLRWLERLGPSPPQRVVVVHAGFDEVSATIARRLPGASVESLDFYDPARHTEASIERARRRRPAEHAVPVDPARLPCENAGFDLGVAFLSAHEIRDSSERAAFFSELRRCSRPDARLVVVEHLRDTANFLAYSVGFLHFHSRAAWRSTFRAAGWDIVGEQKETPFVSTFVLEPNRGLP